MASLIVKDFFFQGEILCVCPHPNFFARCLGLSLNKYAILLV